MLARPKSVSNILPFEANEGINHESGPCTGRAKRTIEGYQQDIKQWQKYALEKGHKTVYNLKLKEIEGFIAKRDVNTARRLISSLKQLSKWYLRDGFPADYRMEGDNQSVRMV